jgi:hypothetical protein
MDTEQRIRQGVKQSLDLMDDLPLQDRLFALGLAWLTTAAILRANGLASPGGWSAAQAAQLELLARMAALVQDDIPDKEAERLFRQRDFDGFLRHVGKRLEG